MKRNLQMAVGAALMAVILWFLFRGTDWTRVWNDLAGANLFWIAVSLVFIFAGFAFRIMRWKYIVRSAKPVGFAMLWDATQIGFLANFTLPARAGEAVRALVLARGAKLPFTKCVAFVALDRVTDLFGLLLVLIVSVTAYRPETAVQFPPGFQLPEWASPILEPDAIRNGAMLAFAAMSVVALGLLVVYLRQGWALAISDAVLGLVSKKFAAMVHDWIQHFADGLHVFRSPVDMAGALFYSTLVWLTAAISIATALYAFHIDAPWYAPALLLSMLSVIIALPGTPGFVGTFHLGIMLGLFFSVPGISAETAKAVAIFAHLANLIPIAITGAHALHRQQAGLFQLGRQAEHLEEVVEES
ncbi:MAG: hypothetical protein GC168_04935 [Candidatus Hydrogenedens sp.]|nr:hypothetical protein [Candidatus Hydrogenedens sp.]